MSAQRVSSVPKSGRMRGSERMRASSAKVQSPQPMARHRTLCIVAATVACSLVPAAAASACAGSRSRPSSASLERAVRATVCLINEARADHGLGALRPPARWPRPPAAHSRDMVRNDFFAHDSPTGSTPKERIDRAGYFDGAVVVGDGRDDRVGQRRPRDAGVDRALVADLARAPGDPPRRPLPGPRRRDRARRPGPRRRGDVHRGLRRARIGGAVTRERR